MRTKGRHLVSLGHARHGPLYMDEKVRFMSRCEGPRTCEKRPCLLTPARVCVSHAGQPRFPREWFDDMPTSGWRALGAGRSHEGMGDADRKCGN